MSRETDKGLGHQPELARPGLILPPSEVYNSRLCLLCAGLPIGLVRLYPLRVQLWSTFRGSSRSI